MSKLTMVVLASMVIVSLSGCALIQFPATQASSQPVIVKPHYPVVPIPDKADVADVSPQEVNPFKDSSDYAVQIMADGKITPEEKAEFDRRYKADQEMAKAGYKKITTNFNNLIDVERKLRLSLEIYNDMAKQQNEAAGVDATAEKK
jgi:hypothetical protein